MLEPAPAEPQTQNKNVQSIAAAQTTIPPENEELEPISVPAPVVGETMDVNSPTDTKKDEMEHDMQQDQDKDGKQHEEPKPSTEKEHSWTESPSNSRSRSPSSKASDDGSLHIPAHVFAPLLIEFLLDQNSSLASLGQQCIVSVATELANAKETENEEYYKKLLDVEIFEGIVMGLMTIVDGRTRHAENDSHDMDNERSSEERSSNFDEGGFMGHHPSADDVDQGEINLAKMMCLSVRKNETIIIFCDISLNDEFFFLIFCSSYLLWQMFWVRKDAQTCVYQ